MRLIGILLCFFCQSAGAANLNEGDMEIQGGFSVSNYESPYYWRDERRTSVSLSSGVQYFLVDQFSAGLDLSVERAGGPRSLAWSLGPVATYYFLVQERFAPFVSLSPFRISKKESVPSTHRSTIRVGAKYFLTDSVAFGPALQYDRQWGWSPRNDFSLLGQFSIHL